MIITKEQDEVLFRIITDKNLLNQYDLIETTVRVALTTNPSFRVDKGVVCEFNRTAVRYLCETAGVYRPVDVGITGREHKPPPYQEVPGLMAEFLAGLSQNWGDNPIRLAA